MALFDEELKDLFESSFRGSAKISRVSEDLRGKTICIYGSNDLGKTKQASRMDNPVFIPCEPGLNAINGAMVLKTSGWTQFTSHVKTLSSRKFQEVLDKGTLITIIIDGVDSLGKYCQDYICSQYGVKDISEGNQDSSIPNLYQLYEKTYWKAINDLTLLGYTVVFIDHEEEIKIKGKSTGKFTLAGDKRCVKPIKDNCDITVHVVSNGVDEENKPIKSSAWLRETDEAFARCRYEMVTPFIEEFTAENLTKAIVEGIKKQNELENVDSINFKEQRSIYEDDEDFESVKEEIKEMYLKLEKMDDNEEETPHLDKYDEIVSDVIGDKLISECTQKNYEALKMIRNNLKDYIDTL